MGNILPFPRPRHAAAESGEGEALRFQVEQLRRAVESPEHEIGIALGMLMVRYELGVSGALEHLTRRAHKARTELRATAEEVVAEFTAPAGASSEAD